MRFQLVALALVLSVCGAVAIGCSQSPTKITAPGTADIQRMPIEVPSDQGGCDGCLDMACAVCPTPNQLQRSREFLEAWGVDVTTPAGKAELVDLCRRMSASN